ncbi:pyridoxal phosphate-dependent aminotransferase [Marinomonas mediterranea]|uniref:alanine transaminase n=1 Tax=Marinomonas mediterranea (strain ATCC 700492 / JCM 21426 / NBRC 103028 / MMB-1) TaxID=717774 RepID=F2JU26_MARM1|nr:pyridoxal phosphate-dependent aminotransferase [Marinomonas mediterranea]ADZ91538.1 Aspartate transaminase [Marinomonas mediterranea MMB-1]WCN17643.1 aminotransferase class I/II-fold pyridoxal phosphate-dependent enzyme [Marinomonas mediterranea MMB-1]
MLIRKSNKLANICYEIRGPVLEEAMRMEDEGQRILKLNIGNPAPFGFEAPDEILVDVIKNLPTAQGYCESKGLFSARKAVMQKYQALGVKSADVNHVWMGNGVSELIVMAMQALLNDGDEILVPAPDYPLWTAAATLSGGYVKHYLCDEDNGWQPDLQDIKSKISNKTKALVIINPNNPTGAVYTKETLQGLVALAEEHGLLLFSDEIYDKILYDGATHLPTSTLTEGRIPCITFGGLSKVYRTAGFRAGWMILTGPKVGVTDYIAGLDMLSSMRLCANVPAQHAVQTALGGYQSINELIVPGGRLYEQRKVAWETLNNIPGVTCHQPEGALYLFPKLDRKMYDIRNDIDIVLQFLKEEKVLIVQGTGFNWPTHDHVRFVFLPHVEELQPAMSRFADFLHRMRTK